MLKTVGCSVESAEHLLPPRQKLLGSWHTDAVRVRRVAKRVRATMAPIEYDKPVRHGTLDRWSRIDGSRPGREEIMAEITYLL